MRGLRPQVSPAPSWGRPPEAGRKGVVRANFAKQSVVSALLREGLATTPGYGPALGSATPRPALPPPNPNRPLLGPENPPTADPCDQGRAGGQGSRSDRPTGGSSLTPSHARPRSCMGLGSPVARPTPCRHRASRTTRRRRRFGPLRVLRRAVSSYLETIRDNSNGGNREVYEAETHAR